MSLHFCQLLYVRQAWNVRTVVGSWENKCASKEKHHKMQACKETRYDTIFSRKVGLNY